MIKELQDKDKQIDLDETFQSLESQGKFDENINPVDWDTTLPVDGDFPFIPKGLLKVKYFFTDLFVVKPFSWYQARVVYKLRVVGKQNLKGLKSAILTSNHVAIFDCLTNSFALRPKRVKIVAAEFNNRKGKFGDWMRAGGMLPLSSNKEAMRKFSSALEHYLQKGHFVLFYPEQSMWEMYPKPRPYKTGAFYYAAKFNVPVVPMFITFRESQKDKNAKYFTLNILKPLYANASLPLMEQARDLAERAYQGCVEVYEQAYGKKLEYANNNQ